MGMGRFLFADLPDAAPEAIRDLFDLWGAKRRTAKMKRGEIPRLSEFENTELARFSDHLALSIYCDQREDVLFMMAGSVLEEVLGVDLNGKWVSESFKGAKCRLAQRPFRAAARAGRPTYCSTVVDQTAEIDCLILPVRSGDDGVSFLSAFFRPKSLFNSLQQHSYAEASEIKRRSFLILKTDLNRPEERERAMSRVLHRVESPMEERRRKSLEVDPAARSASFIRARRAATVNGAGDSPYAPQHVFRMPRI